MFHPTMLLLCSLNIDTFSCTDRIDYSFLTKDKEQIITKELGSLCSFLLSDNILLTNVNGYEIPMLTQFSNYKQITISKYTALVLQRLREAASVFKGLHTQSYDDISDDLLITKIEAIPNSIYSIVYNILSKESPNSRNNKVGIQKLNELRKKILLYRDKEVPSNDNKLLSKIYDLSSIGYWRTLLYHDYIKYYQDVPDAITPNTLEEIKCQLELLDIYGFVPPKQVVQAYASTEVNRKISVTIDDSVIDFLTKIVRSGGVEV